MAPPAVTDAEPAVSRQANEEGLAYGITRVPVDYFHYREYRYTRLIDAIAQAKREENRLGGARTFMPTASKPAFK